MTFRMTVLATRYFLLKNKSFIIPGKSYNLEKLRNERIRLDAHLKNEGYFYFNPRLFAF